MGGGASRGVWAGNGVCLHAPWKKFAAQPIANQLVNAPPDMPGSSPAPAPLLHQTSPPLSESNRCSLLRIRLFLRLRDHIKCDSPILIHSVTIHSVHGPIQRVHGPGLCVQPYLGPKTPARHNRTIGLGI